jgi:hypothetical protein
MTHVSELLAWLPLPGTPGNGMNDWSGSWSHSTIDTEYGILIICLNCFAQSSTMDKLFEKTFSLEFCFFSWDWKILWLCCFVNRFTLAP